MAIEGLPPEREAAYIAGGGVRCPFCGSDDISGGPVEVEAGCAWQNVDCLACDEQWQDLYRLASIERAP